MSERDGDAEPLRVPPWLTGGEPAADPPPPDEPIHDQEPHFVPLAPPELVNARLAPPPADPPEPDQRRRWILAGVATVLLLLPTLLIVSLLDKGKVASPPLGVLPTFSNVSLPVPPPIVPTPVAPSPSLVAPSPSVSSTHAAPPPAPTTTKAVRFGPVTIEAEAPGNVIGGSAWVDRYPGASGGAVVRNLGDWNDRKGAGFLRFAGITVPTDGEYTMKFFYVNIDDERTRTAVITVSDGPAQSLSVQGGATCCTAASVRLTLHKGTNTITFSNGGGHAPSIDRIVLSLP